MAKKSKNQHDRNRTKANNNHKINTPKEIINYIEIGDQLYLKEKFDEAIEAYRKAFENKDQIALAWNGIGLALSRKGLAEEGYSCYKKALDIDNSLAIAWNNIGAYYFQKGLFEQAKNSFSKSIDLEPSQLAYYNLCYLYFQDGQFNSAISFIDKAISINPKNSLLYSSKGFLLLEMGEVDESIKLFNKAIEEDEGNFDAYNSLGFIALVNDDYKLAEDNLTKALSINENYHAALSNLSLLYRDTGNYEKALQYAKDALKNAPTYISSLWIDYAYSLYVYIKKTETTDAGTLADVGEAFARGKKSIISILNEASDAEVDLTEEDAKNIIFSMLDFDYFFLDTIGEIEDTEKYKEIYYKSLKIISLLHITRVEESRFGHYTTMNTAEALLFDESPFRLNTVATANDPEEGLSLLKMLNFHDNTYEDSAFQAFVGCFTFNYDSLNQFRLYGKSNQVEATGISITTDSMFFEQEEPHIINKPIINKNQMIKSKSKEALFRCVYIDPTTNRVISIGHKEDCVFYREEYLYDDVDLTVFEYKKYIEQKESFIIKELNDLIVLTNTLYAQIQQDLEKNKNSQRFNVFITRLPILLIHLRYLIKHYAFKEEQECRIIRVESLFSNPDIIVDESKSRMFIEYIPFCQRKEDINYVTDLYFGSKAMGYNIFKDRLYHSGLAIYTCKSSHPFA